MKTYGLQKVKESVTGFLVVALAVTIASAVVAQETKPAQDIELDFHFLRLGLTRKNVINMLGTPSALAESQTLAIKYQKLMWIGPEGQKYVAAFVHNRLWRWKTCSATVSDC